MTSTLDIAEDSHVAAEVVHTSIDGYWEKFDLAYMLYTTSDRAIPSAYDGLKPVQRRLLYQMYVSRVLPDSKPQKSAKLASATSGNYHPHGDQSVYAAGALLAAHYQRTRLIDGHGSFPRVQGDVPASPRYTEMRLSPEGYELVRELNESPVPMEPTFDGEAMEPRVLPSRFPALVVNGAVGIAEGYSTKVPAHNPREVIALCRAVLDNPKITVEEIVEILHGPDWATGGTVVGTDGIADYITTGRGRLTVRGTAEISGKDIVITALPSGLSSGGFQEKVRSGITGGDFPGISDLTDLTDRRNGLRIVVTVKRGHDPQSVLDSLYTDTPLEDTFAVSIVAVDEDRVPRWWSVPELIKAFLDLRDSVVLRRSEHKLGKAAERSHIVAGFVTVQEDIDAAVSIIRKAEDIAAARDGLMKRFTIDAGQADHVLSMQLRRLTSQDVLELRREAEELSKEITKLTKLVGSRAARKKVIAAELAEVGKIFSTPGYARNTVIDSDASPATRPDDSDSGEVSDKWCLNESGVFGTEGARINSGIGWAVFTDGRVKVTDGKGLRKPGREVTVAPDITALLSSGVSKKDEDLILVTRKGKALRLDISAVNPQGVAGNGVAGVKLADGDDTVVAAFTAIESGAILSISEKAYKVTAVSSVNRKGRGSQGVGFHAFVKGEDGVLEAYGSDTGFKVNGRIVTPAGYAKATTKATADWERA
jgi:DNA gyrase subunit A